MTVVNFIPRSTTNPATDASQEERAHLEKLFGAMHEIDAAVTQLRHLLASKKVAVEITESSATKGSVQYRNALVQVDTYFRSIVSHVNITVSHVNNAQDVLRPLLKR